MTLHTLRPGKPRCNCCDNTGKVPAADGELRPCSRCDHVGFAAWALARRPVSPPAQERRA